MNNELLHRLNEWHNNDEFQKIVDELLQIPESERDYEINSHLARALNNLGKFEEALTQLMLVRDEVKNDYLWHFRIGYAYFYLDRMEDARDEFEKTLELNINDEDAMIFAGWCKEKIQERAGLKQKNFDPDLYSTEQQEAVERHIEKHIGHYDKVFHEIVSPDIHVDIAIIEPSPDRNYYTLVTIGMGAHRMSVPEDLEGENYDRAELIIQLPSDWPIYSTDDLWFWPIKWLKIMARLPGEQNTWLGWGHTVSYGEKLADNVLFTGMIVYDLDDFDKFADKCILPNGECVNFYQLIPLYNEELEYKLNHTQDEMKRLMDRIDSVVNINRLNVGIYPHKKNYLIPAEMIRNLLLDWSEPQGCIATDRIMVDGKKIGYMFRNDPDDSEVDSGWRFLSGDESKEYMRDISNSGIYSLNTLCNYDPDIMPFLRAPYGSAYYRDEDGIFREDSSDYDKE